MRKLSSIALAISLLLLLPATGMAKIDKADAFQKLGSEDAEVRQGMQEKLAREGKSALKILKEYIGDTKNAHRDETVMLLCELKEEKALPILRSALDDKDPAVRKAAACAMGDVPGKFVLKTILKEISGAKGEVREELVLSIARVGTQEAADALGEIIDEPGHRDRPAAVKALGLLPEGLALPHLATSIRDGDATIRRLSVGAIVQLESTSFVSDLVRLLEDPDPATADAAAQALSLMGEQGTQALLGAVRGLTGPVRITAARQLAASKATQAAKDLAISLTEVDKELRLVILEVLGELGAKDQISLILSSASDPDPVMRTAAIKTLMSLQGEEAVPLLEGALNDADLGVRSFALTELVRLKGAAVAPRISQLIVGDDAEMAALAEKAIVEMGPEGVPELIQMTGSASIPLRMRGIELLGRSGDPRAVEPLLRQLRSVDSTYRDAAVLALIDLAPREAKDPLNKLLKRQISSEVRRNVEKALAAIRAKHG